MFLLIQVSTTYSAERRLEIVGAIAGVADIRQVTSRESHTDVVVEAPHNDLSYVRHHIVAHLDPKDAMSVWGPLGGSMQPIIREKLAFVQWPRK